MNSINESINEEIIIPSVLFAVYYACAFLEVLFQVLSQLSFIKYLSLLPGILYPVRQKGWESIAFFSLLFYIITPSF